MFTVDLQNGYEIQATFKHFPDNIWNPGTNCTLWVVDQETKMPVEWVTGYSSIGKRKEPDGTIVFVDQFSRPVGREVSLRKAIDKLVPREFVGVRRMLWDAYFKASKHDPRPVQARGV